MLTMIYKSKKSTEKQTIETIKINFLKETK